MIVPIIIIIIICVLYFKESYDFQILRDRAITEGHSKNTHNGEDFFIDWDLIKNEDAVAWIRFKSIKKISYPIMQAADNQYYLHRNIKKKYSFSGSIFMDQCNKNDFSDQNTIIYGHNMADGSMFGSLKTMMDKDYQNHHPFFFIYTKNGKILKYRIYNACIVSPTSSIYTYSFASLESFQKYLLTWEKNSLYKTKKVPSVKDKIVTLSTCTQHGTKRFVVQGYLVKSIIR